MARCCGNGHAAFGDEQPTIASKQFAKVPAVDGEFEFNLRYPGQYFDKESGLHYNGFRTYDPLTGRYTQGDPIGLDGEWNRFGYVGGNPLMFTDPRGLDNPSMGPYGPGPNNYGQGFSPDEQSNQA